MQISSRITAGSPGVVVVGAVVVAVVVVVVVVVLILRLHVRCSLGKLASDSNVATLERQLARWVLSRSVARPIARHAARARAQFTDWPLIDRFNALIPADSCLYSAWVSLPLGGAAAADAEVQMTAPQIATSLAAAFMVLGTTPSVGHPPPDPSIVSAA
jgi:hypothetical protein